MAREQVIIKESDGWIELRLPYNEEFNAKIKETHYKEREWTGECWRVKPEHLEAARVWAKETGYPVFDYTLYSKEEIEARIEEFRKAFEKELTEKFIALLPQVEMYTFKVTRLDMETIELELVKRVDNGLFHQLREASLKAHRQGILAYGLEQKRGWGYKLIIPNNQKTLTTLITTDRRIGNFEYHPDLTVVNAFEGGVAHFVDEVDEVYLGMKQEIGRFDANETSHDWEWTIVDGQIYSVVNRDVYLAEWMKADSTTPVYFGGAFAVAMSNQSQVYQIVTTFRLEEWFKEHAHSVVKSTTVTPSNSYYRVGLYYPHGYHHPAENLISHLMRFKYGTGCDKLLQLLGWTFEDVKAIEATIDAIKQAAADAKIAEHIADSWNLASVLVSDYKKADFIQLADRHGIEYKKSWNRQRLLETVLDVEEVRLKILSIPQKK